MMNDPQDIHHPRTPPYRFQEFPRMLHMDGKTCIVQNTEEKEAALAKGWQLQPQVTPAVAPSSADLDQVAEEQSVKEETKPKAARKAAKGR